LLPLSLDGVTFEAGGRRIIDRVSTKLDAGPRTVILGANGAGKSVLLRLCHGLLAPTAGTIKWNTPELPGGPRRQAMVFQRPVLLRRSVLGNVMYALRLAGVPQWQSEAHARAALCKVGLDLHADHAARVVGELRMVCVPAVSSALRCAGKSETCGWGAHCIAFRAVLHGSDRNGAAIAPVSRVAAIGRHVSGRLLRVARDIRPQIASDHAATPLRHARADDLPRDLRRAVCLSRIVGSAHTAAVRRHHLLSGRWLRPPADVPEQQRGGLLGRGFLFPLYDAHHRAEARA
jgi:tungstate transport system ATP-binding protein